MGTNFYIRGHDQDFDSHIGKRSAAGAYCWDCNVTLCKGGNSQIHHTHWETRDVEWYKECPKCGKAPVIESLATGSAGRELGFNEEPPAKKKGVASCSSFRWAMSVEEFMDLVQERPIKCHACKHLMEYQDKPIENEYGDLFTVEEFQKMLEECPVQYYDNIGEFFS